MSLTVAKAEIRIVLTRLNPHTFGSVTLNCLPALQMMPTQEVNVTDADTQIFKKTPSLDEDALPPPACDSPRPYTWMRHLQRFMRFVGPTWLIAVSFVDPGKLLHSSLVQPLEFFISSHG